MLGSINIERKCKKAKEETKGKVTVIKRANQETKQV